MATKEYKVELRRTAALLTTVATVRGFGLELGAKSGDPTVGFNPAETLLAAVGACITSSLGLVASNSDVEIGALEVVVSGIRQDAPPRMISIHYALTIETKADDQKVERILRLAERNSTVVSTLQGALNITGEWRRLKAVVVDRSKTK